MGDGNTHLYDVWMSDSLEEELLDLARDGATKREIADRAREATEESIEYRKLSGFIADLVRWALDDIDWWGIATEIEEQAKTEEEEEEEEDGDDVCDICGRSNVVCDQTTADGRTVCVNCAEDWQDEWDEEND